MAMSLAQGEAGFASFDAGMLEPPELPRPGSRSSDAPSRTESPPARRPVGASDRRELERYSGMLAGYARQTPVQRVTSLRGLAAVGDSAADVSQDQAEKIARYLLSTKADDEHAEVVRLLAAFRHWKRLRLAVADLAPHSQLTTDQQQQLAGAFLGRDTLPDATSGEGFRRQLIDSVLLDLTTTASRTSSGSDDPNLVFDSAADLLAETYRQRARNFGVSGPAFQSAASPAQALELSLGPLAESLRGSTDDAAYLADLGHIHKAAKYVAGDDLRQSIAMQRLLVELSARRAIRQRPQQAAAARQIETESLAAVTGANSALHQLREQEAALLQLWMLYAPEICGGGRRSRHTIFHDDPLFPESTPDPFLVALRARASGRRVVANNRLRDRRPAKRLHKAGHGVPRPRGCNGDRRSRGVARWEDARAIVSESRYRRADRHRFAGALGRA
jgi:hypothetical protein